MNDDASATTRLHVATQCEVPSSLTPCMPPSSPPAPGRVADGRHLLLSVDLRADGAAVEAVGEVLAGEAAHDAGGHCEGVLDHHSVGRLAGPPLQSCEARPGCGRYGVRAACEQDASRLVSPPCLCLVHHSLGRCCPPPGGRAGRARAQPCPAMVRRLRSLQLPKLRHTTHPVDPVGLSQATAGGATQAQIPSQQQRRP